MIGLRNELARVTAERDAMRPVVEAAVAWNRDDREGQALDDLSEVCECYEAAQAAEGKGVEG